MSILTQVEALTQQVSKLKFHTDMLPSDIRRMRSELSDIYAEARPLYMQARRAYDRYERMLSTAKKTIFLVAEKEGADGKKNTEKEREGLAFQLLETQPIGGETKPILTLIDEAEAVLASADALMDIIKDKNDAIIAFMAMIKAEKNIDNAPAAQVF